MLLTKKQILKRLEGGEILKNGTWDKGNLRPTSYDLRMSDDTMIVPDHPKFPQGRKYTKTQKRKIPVIIRPGEVAYITSREIIGIPWDVSAIVGLKFSLVVQGILVFTGDIIHPGMGLGQNFFEKKWDIKNFRLNLLIANVGSQEVILKPGEERIASLQFYQIDSDEIDKKAFSFSEGTMSKGGEYLENQFMQADEKNVGLVFFRNMLEIKDKYQNLEKSFIEIRGKVMENENKVEIVEKSSNQILMFGVYLFAVTILGVSFSTILSLLTRLEIKLSLHNTIILLFSISALSIISLKVLDMLKQPFSNKKEDKK